MIFHDAAGKNTVNDDALYGRLRKLVMLAL